MADDKDKKIGEVPHLENVTGREKIPVSAGGEPRYVDIKQIYDKEVTPYPREREIVYTTVSGNAIEWEDISSDIISNTYYKDKGFGKIVISNGKIPNITNNDDLKSLIIGEGFTADGKINDCSNLEKVWIGDGITKLSGCFQNCYSLKDVKLPNTLLSLDYAFQQCVSLTEITLPDSVETLSRFVFANCENLVSINFPSSLTSIGWDSFFNTGFTSLYLPDTITTLGTTASGVLRGLKNLISIRLPNKITTCWKLLLSDCPNLQEVIIPNKVEEIQGSAFANSGIKRLTIPSSVKTIGVSVFQKCNQVENIDSSIGFIESFPSVNNLRTLILRANKVIEDVDTYVSTFTLEEGQELPMGAKLLTKPKSAPMASAEGEIMPMTNLDQYIGTPNNWLKIYVPANLLKAYQERYPTLKRHLHPITGEDIYAMKDDLKEKEDIVQIEVVEGESLEAKVNRYYRFDSPVNTLAVTLPNIPEEENPRLKALVLSFTTGDAPQVTISGNANVDYFDGYSIDANKTYELNIMFNGVKWIVAYGVVE